MNTNLTISSPVSYVGTYCFRLIMGCVIFISACSLLKEKSFYQADSLAKHDINQNVQSEAITVSKAIRIYNSSDSAETQYYIEIIPKGKFKYSETEGFSGEAERLKISGRMKEGRQVYGSSALLQRSKVKSVMESSNRSTSRTRLKEKKSWSANLSLVFIAGCAGIFLLIYWFRRYLR